MAQDVNQSETEVAAQVRSALVARISQERYELWMPADCGWSWVEGALRLSFPTDFACQIARRMLQDDLHSALTDVIGQAAPLILEVQPSASASSPARDSLTFDTQPGGSRVADTHDRNTSTLIAGDTRSPSTPSQSNSAQPDSTQQPGSSPTDASQPSSTRQSQQQTSAGSNPVDSSRPVTDIHLANNPTAGARSRNDRQVDEPSLKPSASSAEYTRPKADYWSDFIPGASSQLAWTTINLVANDPGRMTPALIHGPFGVGKSHLASALAQRLRMQRRQRRVLHITAEQFTNDFTEAIRGSGLPMLRRKYRDVDTLILDDLQFLVGKKATINELRHTLDNLLKAGRQLVFFSDRPPSELEALGSDFVGRLRGGLVSPLMPLDEETRYQILKRDLRAADVAVSDDIVLQIASRAIGDGRLLKGISNRLQATAYISQGKLTWDQCWNSIYDLIQATQPIVRLGDIERVVCEVFGLEPNSLQSDRKTRSVSQPRMLAMFLARKYTPAAYQEIGDYFGQRRHSTVISAEKTVGSWLEDNAKLQLPRGSLAIRDAMRHVEANLHVG